MLLKQRSNKTRFLHQICPVQLHRGAGASPSCHYESDKVHPGQVCTANKSSILMLTATDNLKSYINLRQHTGFQACGRKSKESQHKQRWSHAHGTQADL